MAHVDTMQTMTGFEDSTPLLDDPAALRQRGREHGYLYFRGLLPREPLRELRRQILAILHQQGWLRTDAPWEDGLIDAAGVERGCVLDESMRYLGVTLDVYRQIQQLEPFHRLPHHPNLIKLYERLLEGEVLVHPRHIARTLIPMPDFAATPPHQDYTHIQGAHGFWTCWFPLSDCPVQLGGLSVLDGSHREGVLPVAAARGAGGKESILCNKVYSWVQGDYACGDVITFTSQTIHRGLPNLLGDRVRLSLDLRYQRMDEPVEERSLKPHMNVATWEELYAGWKSDDLKYYWQAQNLILSAFDQALVTTKEKIC